MAKNKHLKERKRPLIGLALGGGGARGWAHIGVLRTLQQCGIEPDIVCGTSIGALVGAAYASEQLDQLEAWISQLRWQEVVSLLDFSFSSGVIEGEKLFNFFRQKIEDVDIEDLSRRYAAVATRLDNGQEIWLREGSTMQAVRSSIALPGIFTPVSHEHFWLVDGGLVNPVPVSVCRALGADIVIAVGLHNREPVHHLQLQASDKEISDEQAGLTGKIKQWFREGVPTLASDNGNAPSLLDVVTESIDIMQLRVMRSRMAGDPPEIMIRPKTSDIGFLEFHRGIEAIEAGKVAAEKVKEELRLYFSPDHCEPS